MINRDEPIHAIHSMRHNTAIYDTEIADRILKLDQPTETTYVVCNRLLDSEMNRYCEYDGDVTLNPEGTWRCPACGVKHYA